MSKSTGVLSFIPNPSSEDEQPPVVETDSNENEESETSKQTQHSDSEEQPLKGTETTSTSWVESHNLTEEEYTKQKEELEALRIRSKDIEVDDFVKGYNEYIKNGGSPKEYIEKQAKILAMDFEKMPQIDAVRQAYVLDFVDKGMTEEEAVAEWEDYKAEMFDIYEEDSPEWNRKVKKAFFDAKPTLESYKKKLATPTTSSNQPKPLTPEQMAEQEKANKEFVAKYNKEQPIEFSFKAGEKELSLKDKGNLYANFQKELESSDLMASYRKEDGSVDEDKFLRAMYVAKNADKLFQLAYQQGATDFEANKLEEARNPKEKDSANVPTSSVLESNLTGLRNAFSKKG